MVPRVSRGERRDQPLLTATPTMPEITLAHALATAIAHHQAGRLADAERDGDRIYAVIRGLGSSSDGKGNAIYAPSAAGQTKALRNAYQLADISPATVELVEGHGMNARGDDIAERICSTINRSDKQTIYLPGD